MVFKVSLLLSILVVLGFSVSAKAEAQYCPRAFDLVASVTEQINVANKKLNVSRCKTGPSYSTATPEWLKPDIGLDKNQIAPVVLERARIHYQNAKAEGRAKNPCYMAMDATRPHDTGDDLPNARFYIICEEQKIFLPVSAGHGGGIQYDDHNFKNGRKCSQFFSNAVSSNLSMGGRYVTDEMYDSKKGFRVDPVTKEETPFSRVFIRWAGEGETSTSLERDIGGHAAEFISPDCYKYQPDSPYADPEGYVMYGEQVSYADGRSNGCTSWTQETTDFVATLVSGKPTSLYIYPESADIQAVRDQLAKKDSSAPMPYWNEECLKEIGQPQFLSKEEYGETFKALDDKKTAASAQKKKDNPNWRKICPSPG